PSCAPAGLDLRISLSRFVANDVTQASSRCEQRSSALAKSRSSLAAPSPLSHVRLSRNSSSVATCGARFAAGAARSACRNLPRGSFVTPARGLPRKSPTDNGGAAGGGEQTARKK